MNNFENYYFIYEDSHGRWNQAKNPVFIAEHKACRAIEKYKVTSIGAYLQKLNKKEKQ